MSSKTVFYAVARGRKVGVLTSWAECEASTSGFSGAKYQKVANEAAGRAWLAANVDHSFAQGLNEDAAYSDDDDAQDRRSPPTLQVKRAPGGDHDQAFIDYKAPGREIIEKAFLNVDPAIVVGYRVVIEAINEYAAWMDSLPQAARPYAAQLIVKATLPRRET